MQSGGGQGQGGAFRRAVWHGHRLPTGQPLWEVWALLSTGSATVDIRIYLVIDFLLADSRLEGLLLKQVLFLSDVLPFTSSVARAQGGWQVPLDPCPLA